MDEVSNFPLLVFEVNEPCEVPANFNTIATVVAEKFTLVSSD